jgi:hypothetical protein
MQGGSAAGGSAAGGSAAGGSQKILVACEACLRLHNPDVDIDTAFVHMRCLSSEQRAAARAGTWRCGNDHEMPQRLMVEEQLQRSKARITWYRAWWDTVRNWGDPKPQPTGPLLLREDQCEICHAVFTQREWDAFNFYNDGDAGTETNSEEDTTRSQLEIDTMQLTHLFFDAGPNTKEHNK